MSLFRGKTCLDKKKADVTEVRIPDDYGNVIVHWGKYSKGKRVADLKESALTFYAGKEGGSVEDRILSGACRRRLMELEAMAEAQAYIQQEPEDLWEKPVEGYGDQPVFETDEPMPGMPDCMAKQLHSIQDFMRDDEGIGLYGNVPISVLHKENYWINFSSIKSITNLKQAKKLFWEGQAPAVVSTSVMQAGSDFHDAFLLGHKEVAPKQLEAANRLKKDCLEGKHGLEMKWIAQGATLNECAFRVQPPVEDSPCLMVGKFDILPFGGESIYDIKTCGKVGKAEAMKDNARKLGYHLQAAIYLHAARVLGLEYLTRFKWVFAERDTGKAVVVECDGALLLRGETELARKCELVKQAHGDIE